jgi:ABC-2 type transport system permease protein
VKKFEGVFMKLLNLFKVEALKYFLELKRYFFNTVSSLLSIYIIFLAYFFGFKFMGGPNMDTGKLDVFIVGYIMWMFALISFQSNSYLIYDEMQKGTFEQLYLCSMGIETSILFRMFMDLIFSFIFNGIIFYLTMLTTGRYFSIPFLKIFIPLMISLPSLWGLGYIFGGLTLIYKKTVSFLQIMQFAIIVLVAVDAYPLNFFSFLPFSAGATTVQGIINFKETFPLSWFFFLSAISLFYYFVGLALFRYFLKRAKKQNLLGQY